MMHQRSSNLAIKTYPSEWFSTQRCNRMLATAVIMIFVMGLLLPAASGCAARLPAARHLQRSNQPADLENPTGFKMVTGQAEYGPDADQINFTISNDTDENALFGASFSLEVQLDGAWYMVPYTDAKPGTEMTWPAISYQVPAHGTGVGAIRLSSLVGIEPGSYRLIKEVTKADGLGKPFPVAATFTIRPGSATTGPVSPTTGRQAPTTRSGSPTTSGTTKMTAARPSAAAVPPACERLWTLDPGLKGFARVAAYRSATFTCGDVSLNLNIRPKAFDDFNPARWEENARNSPSAFQFWKKSTPEGQPYYLYTSAASWDARDEKGWRSGTLYNKSLHLDEGSLCYVLNGDTGQENVDLDIVSLDTLRQMTANPDGSPSAWDGGTWTGEYWQASFQNGNMSFSITVRPQPFADQAYADWAGYEYVSRKGSGSSEYFQTDRQTGPDAPMSTAMAFRSGIGLIEVRGGVPFGLRKEVPGDALDFITIDYVRELVDRLK